jgi:hypothetical protein
MRPLRPRYWILPVALAVASVWLSTPATATSAVTCGETITQDTTLTTDLTNCPGNGLVIGADNLRLDLGGHRISGAAHGALQCYSGGGGTGPCDGVSLVEHGGLTITNGAITGFDTGIGGVGADFTTNNHISRLRITGTVDDAILVGTDNVVTANRVDGPIVVVARSEVAFNSGTGRASIFGFGGDHDRIEYNAVPRVDLHAATDGYVAHNVTTGGGIVAEGGADNGLITSNILPRSNIFVGASNNDIVSHNVLFGPLPNLNGIRVGFDPFSGHSGPDGVQVTDNVVVGFGIDGIEVDYNGAASHTLVNGNVVVENGHDGIENGDATATLARNIAIANQALGIESVPGATDGGGNRAAANGDPLECTVIACH